MIDSRLLWCWAWGTVSERGNSDISADRDYSVDLIVVIRIQPQLPRRWPHLVHTAPGCWRLFKTLLHPPPSLPPSVSLTSAAVLFLNILCRHIFFFFYLFLSSTSMAASCFWIISTSIFTCLLNLYTPPLLSLSSWYYVSHFLLLVCVCLSRNTLMYEDTQYSKEQKHKAICVTALCDFFQLFSHCLH